MTKETSSHLSPRQQRFVEEYLVDLCATQAAIRAGYSKKTAEQQGYQLLQKTSVQSAIKAAIEARSERTEITQDWVLERLVENVERAMQASAVLDDDGNAIGAYTYQGAVANKALELLGKHVGLWKEDSAKPPVLGTVSVLATEDVELIKRVLTANGKDDPVLH